LAGDLNGELLRISDLTIDYAQSGDLPTRALAEAALQINQGEVIGVLGESGSGKSSLAYAILRLLPAHARVESGSILFRQRNLMRLQESELRAIRGKEIALIPQDPAVALNPVMRVGDQIGEVIRAHVALSRQKRRHSVEALLQSVGFDQPRQISSAYPHELSGGQRQRIAVAQAIACSPALVIADEPTSSLDASLRAEIIELLLEIRRRQGTAFLLISHDPTIFPGFADRMIVMYQGRVVEEGTTAEVFLRARHPYTRVLVRLSERYLAPPPASRGRFPVIEISDEEL
jgi:ABC-type glutathione transport system ATPase component